MKTITTIALLLLASALVSAPGTGTAQRQEPVIDEDVKVGHFEDMKYPPAARLAPAQGAVVVKVRLDDEGSVVEVTFEQHDDIFLPLFRPASALPVGQTDTEDRS